MEIRESHPKETKEKRICFKEGIKYSPFFDRNAKAGRGEGQLCGREDERASIELH